MHTWSGHAPPDSQGIFTSPLVKFLLHLLYLCWVQGPQAALSGGVPILVFHFFKAFVQREVVSDRILPAIRCCLRNQWFIMHCKVVAKLLRVDESLLCGRTVSKIEIAPVIYPTKYLFYNPSLSEVNAGSVRICMFM